MASLKYVYICLKEVVNSSDNVIAALYIFRLLAPSSNSIGRYILSVLFDHGIDRSGLSEKLLTAASHTPYSGSNRSSTRLISTGSQLTFLHGHSFVLLIVTRALDVLKYACKKYYNNGDSFDLHRSKVSSTVLLCI